jgi:hypothetical protein
MAQRADHGFVQQLVPEPPVERLDEGVLDRLAGRLAAIEWTGSWKMEIRSDTKAELATVERRLEVLSQPKAPIITDDPASPSDSGGQTSK